MSIAALLLVAAQVLSPAVQGAGSVLSADDSRYAYTRPVEGLTDAERERFFRGRSLFRQSWVVAPAGDSEVDGLGPVYNRLACISCHPGNGRGRAPERPGERMQAMLLRLSVPDAGHPDGPRPHPAYGDQLNEEGIPGVPGEGRALVDWELSAAVLADGETVAMRHPVIRLEEPAFGPFDGVLISPRIGQPVYGAGLLDAVSEDALERMAAESKPDGVVGRVNRVRDISRHKQSAGRFGFKANMPDLRQQIAGAMIGDLGITSSLFPVQNCTAIQDACRQAPDGGAPELSDAALDDLEFYLAHLAVPARRNTDDPDVREGERLFAAIGCGVCHRSALVTGVHPRFARLSRRVIAPYTDLLLHDMGERLADHRPDFLATGREWRTAPLWGIGLAEKVGEEVGFLHDGRARTLQEAILWHGGEAAAARRRFAGLSSQARGRLIAFLNSL